MNKFTLPPSPNWQLSNILACNDNGIVAFGSRGEVSIINVKSGRKFNVSNLRLAHKDKVNVIVFSPSEGSFSHCMSTCGDDGMVRVWDFRDSRLLYYHSGHKNGVKVTGLDWSRADTNRLVSVNDLGSIVCWDLASNTIRTLHCGVKVLPLCLACCPHDKDLVAIGCKGGVTLVINVKGDGKIVHRLRAQEQDVISLSWCPVPYNVIKRTRNVDSKTEGNTSKLDGEEEGSRDLLLATGGVDKFIFIWRTGSDGRFETALHLPSQPMSSGKRRTVASNLLWTCVLWTDAHTLLSTSQFGELLAWDLDKLTTDSKSGSKKKPQVRLLHSLHHKGCFSIACPIVAQVEKVDERVVWTTAMDKHLVACKLSSGSVVLDIPTLGGAVFCMAHSPLDPNRLAIGSSDSKVFVWNMSDLDSLNITSYWKKIIGKVMALCWHPREENLLAYGTSDGHIGIIDVGSNKIPTLLRLHHRKQVYRVCWSPPLLQKDIIGERLVLYSVGDGDVVQYTANPAEPNQEPLSLNDAVLNNFDKDQGYQKSLIRSDVAFKPDSTCFVVSNENGSVYVVSCSTLTLQHVLYPHKKVINNLEWHPETVASDNHISPYKDWLAISCEKIKVYNVPAEGQPELVATLSGHSMKIVGLNWSPHYNGRLISASYDFSVQVWDVITQTCLGIYLDHGMAVMCALFSPLDPDIAISGSFDCTVRLWPISELSSSISVPDKKKDRVEKGIKKRALEAKQATELTGGVTDNSNNEEAAATQSTSATTNNQFEEGFNKGLEEFKKRQMSRAVFKVTGSKLAQAKHFDVLYERLTCAPSQPSLDDDSPSDLELGYLDFFGDDRAMRNLLMVEESRLIQSGVPHLAQQSAQWRGDVSQLIDEAITKKQLSEWLISIAPVAGFDKWEKACEAYAEQLTECGDVIRASSYLLAVHKVHEAVRLLADYKHFREAVAIAKCRLTADDALTAQVYTEWGQASRHQGALNLAVHCFLAANNIEACIETLARLKELKSLRFAANLAKHKGLVELADSLATDCLTMSVLAGNQAVGHQLVADMPEYKHWTVWLRASEAVAKVKNRNEKEVFSWLEGQKSGPVALWDDLTSACSSLGPVHAKLLPLLPSNKTPEFERDMWFFVSGRLAAAWAARQEGTPAQVLRHLVSALSAAFHFQNSQPQSLALLLTLTLIAPTGLFANESIFTKEYETSEEKLLLKSLKAFACASVVHWMSSNSEKIAKLLSEKTPEEKGSGDCVIKCTEFELKWLPDLITRWGADTLDAESVSFFVKKAQKQELQKIVTQENLLKRSEENKTGNNSEDRQVGHSNKTENVTQKTENEKPQSKSNVEVEVISDNVKTKVFDVNLNETNGNKNISESTDKNGVHKSSNGIGNDECSKLVQETQDKLNRNEFLKTDIPLTLEDNKMSTVNTENGIPDLNKTENATIQKMSLKSDATCASKESSQPSNEVKVDVKMSTNALQPKQEADEEIGSSKPNIVVTALQNSVKNTSNVVSSNGFDKPIESEDSPCLKVKEIKELDEVLLKFETERVSVPCPFTAYTNIRYLLDNLIVKQDSKLAQKLREDCDRVWKISQQ